MRLEKNIGPQGKKENSEGKPGRYPGQEQFLKEIERESRMYERCIQLVRHIERALERINNGSFGYCVITGNRIGLRRLEVLPFAHMSVEVLETKINHRQNAYTPKAMAG